MVWTSFAIVGESVTGHLMVTKLVSNLLAKMLRFSINSIIDHKIIGLQYLFLFNFSCLTCFLHGPTLIMLAKATNQRLHVC